CLSLKLMDLKHYVLVGVTNRQRRSNEEAMKYFLLGAFLSGILLDRMSLIYGVTGSTNLTEIGKSIGSAGPELRPMLLLGMIALAAGLFFKVAAVPFPMWARDAYEAGPASVPD